MGRPSIYLPCCMIIWGIISCLTGITTKCVSLSIGSHPTYTVAASFSGALLTRFFLGFVEAAFFPGALFLLSKWYTRKELGLRTAFLFCGSLISNAFGSLIASGILDGMDGKLGHAAWRYAFHVAQDFSSLILLADGYSTSKGLSRSLSQYVQFSFSQTSRQHPQGGFPLKKSR